MVRDTVGGLRFQEKDALDLISSRLDGAEPGQLSLAPAANRIGAVRVGECPHLISVMTGLLVATAMALIVHFT
jgi:hypothetical protein